MKKLNWHKVLRYSIVLIIFVGLVDCGSRALYVPKSVGAQEFPLQLKWSTKLRGSPEEVSITDNIILARSSYSMNAIDLETGTPLWKHIFDEATTSVLADSKNVYLVTEENLYAFEENTGDIKWQKSLWQDSGSYPGHAWEITDVSNNLIVINFISNEFRIYATESGDYIASIPAGRGEQDACIFNNALYTFNDHPASYDLSTGKLIWEDKSTGNIWGPMCQDGIVYFAHKTSEITAYDLEAKSILWSIPLVTETVRQSDISTQDSYLFVGDRAKLYILDKQSGTLIKSIGDKERPVYPGIIDTQLFVFYFFDRTIYSYDKESWTNLGILRIYPPVVLASEKRLMYHHNETLLLLKGKTIFAYR
jgi:outer membrane protein assembly factor BamB